VVAERAATVDTDSKGIPMSHDHATGAVVVVTGALSAIGEATALAFAQRATTTSKVVDMVMHLASARDT
jgi:hypothetical protein